MNKTFKEQISNIPAFIGLHKAYRENFNAGNYYVRHFMPETKQICLSESGKSKLTCLKEEEREELAKEELLSDNSGWFSEFVHDDAIREDVTEVIRFIFKEYEKNSPIP